MYLFSRIFKKRELREKYVQRENIYVHSNSHWVHEGCGRVGHVYLMLFFSFSFMLFSQRKCVFWWNMEITNYVVFHLIGIYRKNVSMTMG